MAEPAKAGTVGLVGRPNAGKSTLMNRLLADKIAIVSDKPQTTRHRLVGILSGERGQMVFHDTPGMHRPLHRMNREMVQQAEAVLAESDVVCLIVDASESFGAGDRYLLDLVERATAPRVLVLNKIDRIAKESLLPLIERYATAVEFAEVVPVSALEGDGCQLLLDLLWDLLPTGEPLYDPELVTVHPERFLAAELIREKVLRHTRDELPFTTAVLLDRWEEEPADEGGEGGGRLLIYASILVEKPGQKSILIGRQGRMIKRIGSEARHDLNRLLGRRVHLELHVRLEPGWREDRRLLARLARDAYASAGLDEG